MTADTPREPVTEAMQDWRPQTAAGRLALAFYDAKPRVVGVDHIHAMGQHILAIEAEARAAGLREAPTGARLVLVSEDAERLFFGRDDDGNRLTFEWGEPDEHGWYTPTVTVHIGEGAAPKAAPAEGRALDVDRTEPGTDHTHRFTGGFFGDCPACIAAGLASDAAFALGAAWQRCEAALPGGYDLSLKRQRGGYVASARPAIGQTGFAVAFGLMDTATSVLNGLADDLARLSAASPAPAEPATEGEA